MPTKLAINRYWAKARPDLVCDSEELSCFACGYWWNGRYDNRPEDIPLEKAHIHPRSEGGENVVENLVLLCKKCHSEAPMSVSRQVFLNWLNKKEPFASELLRNFETELQIVGVSREAVEAFLTDEGISSLTEFIYSTKLTPHGHPMWGPKTPLSTYAARIAEFVETRKHKLCKSA